MARIAKLCRMNTAMNTATHVDIEQVLAEHRIGINASELHGSLCGYLCAGGAANADAWCAALALEALQDAMQDDAQTRAAMQRFYRLARTALIDPDLGFTPLLPDAEQGVPVRAGALVEWCRGYVGGLGLAGNSETTALSADARELLADLARIASSDLQTGDSDDDEADFTEVLEYVRMGVLLLQSELTAVAPGSTRH